MEKNFLDWGVSGIDCGGAAMISLNKDSRCQHSTVLGQRFVEPADHLLDLCYRHIHTLVHDSALGMEDAINGFRR